MTLWFRQWTKFPRPNLSTSFDVRDVGCTVWPGLRYLSKHKYLSFQVGNVNDAMLVNDTKSDSSIDEWNRFEGKYALQFENTALQQLVK